MDKKYRFPSKVYIKLYEFLLRFNLFVLSKFLFKPEIHPIGDVDTSTFKQI